MSVETCGEKLFLRFDSRDKIIPWVRKKEHRSTWKRGMEMDITTVSDSTLERYITDILLDAGVPAHLKGYHYLREAIICSVRDREVVCSVTKLLYPEIAKRFKTTNQKVERAIRNAIEISWERGNTETFEKIFGYSSLGEKYRPTNSAYIAGFANKVYMDFIAM